MTFIKYSFFFFLLALCKLSVAQEIPTESSATSTLDWAKPKEYTIAGIEVECSEYTDKNIVRLLSGITYGDKVQIPGDKISEAIKNLCSELLIFDSSDVSKVIKNSWGNYKAIEEFLKENKNISQRRINKYKDNKERKIKKSGARSGRHFFIILVLARSPIPE